MATYDVAEAAEEFENLVDRVLLGEEVIIARDGVPVVQIVRYEDEVSSGDAK